MQTASRRDEDLNVARSRGQGTDDLQKAIQAAQEGRVFRLLIEVDRRIPGSIDLHTGTLRTTESSSSGGLLDGLAELVLRRKREVIVVPRERMPTTGLAAIYRF